MFNDLSYLEVIQPVSIAGLVGNLPHQYHFKTLFLQFVLIFPVPTTTPICPNSSSLEYILASFPAKSQKEYLN